jgi:hypothetical protein
MTLGRGKYSQIPLSNLARPYGSVTRSRYREAYGTKEAWEKLKGYKGEAYYFLRVIKSGQNYLLPLRKINIISAKTEGDRIYVVYNLLDYSFIRKEADAATLYEKFKGEMKKEPSKFDDLCVFCALKDEIISLISYGKTIDDWLKTVGPLKEIVPTTDVMDSKNKKPLIMCAIIRNASDSQVVSYDDKGIELDCGGTYKITACLDMLENHPYSKVRMKLTSDEESLKAITGEMEFFTAYDESELVFCVVKKLIKGIDKPLTSYLDIAFSFEAREMLPPDINFSVVIMPRFILQYSWYFLFFVGVVIATSLTYLDKVIAQPVSIYTIYLVGTIIATFVTTLALGKIGS